MPEVYVYAVEGRSIEQKRSLVKDITDAVVKNFRCRPTPSWCRSWRPPRTPRPRAACCSATARRGEPGRQARKPLSIR